MWVPGQTIHHQPPIRWVRNGGKTGWVPIHPSDVAGKLPVNAQHGVFTVTNRNRFTLDRTPVNSAGGVKLLDAAPREFRKVDSPVLARTDAPRMEAHMIRPGPQSAGPANLGGNHTGPVRSVPASSGALQAGIDHKSGPGTSIPIVFDHRSQSFMMSRRVVQGSNIRTVNEPVGSYLARSGVAFGGRQGFPSDSGGYRNSGGVSGANSGSTGFHGGGLAGGTARGGDSGPYSASRGSTGASNSGSNQGGGTSQSSAGPSQGSSGGSFHGGGSAPSSGGSAPSTGAHR
jgi:hypothetical protein